MMNCRKSSSLRSSARRTCRTRRSRSPRSTPKCSRSAARPTFRKSPRRRRTCTLRPQPQNGGSGLIAFIRGVGQTDFNYALDPGVGIYVDDVYIPTLSSSLLELIDLDRVEILRGPQGTLAGKNSIGGAIKLFSAKPKGDGSGSLRVSYGSYNELNVRGMADFEITDNLAMRVSGMSRGARRLRRHARLWPDASQFERECRQQLTRERQFRLSDDGWRERPAGRAALRWTPNDQRRSQHFGRLHP